MTKGLFCSNSLRHKTVKKKFKNNSTFQSNISRYHRDIQLTDFKSLLLPEQKVEPLWLDQGDTDEVIPDIHENSDQSTKDTSQEKTDHEKPFLESLALLYLKLQAKFFILASIILLSWISSTASNGRRSGWLRSQKRPVRIPMLSAAWEVFV